MKKEWKILGMGMTVSVLLYMLFPIMIAYLLYSELCRENALLPLSALSAAIAAASGAAFVRRRSAGGRAMVTALCVGPLMQVLSALPACLLCNEPLQCGDGRWILAVASFLSGWLTWVFVQPKGKRKRRKPRERSASRR